MISALSHFNSVWIVIAKVHTRFGERHQPLVLLARDVGSNMVVELGVPKLLGVRHPPYPTGPQALLVTVDANEVAACHLALGWRMPERIVDLMVEFRNLTRGNRRPIVGGLAGALIWFGQRATGALVEGASPQQMRRRLAAVAALFDAMQASLDVGRAMLRGRYLCAVARIEATGIPVDRRTSDHLAQNWPAVRDRVVEIIDQGYGVYQGRRLDVPAFEGWLAGRGISWPVVASGRLDLSDQAFREMARVHPCVRPLKELRATLLGFDPNALAIGRDGRNRTPVLPFVGSTGRNQPSAKHWVMETAAWVRHLIKPKSGAGLALIDWEQQEFGIAAALSGDTGMQRAYTSGDPYLALAIASGAAPPEATAATHPQIRERYKVASLGIQYGIGAVRLAGLLGLREVDAKEMLRLHKAAFPRFWSWSDDVEARAMLYREQHSAFGWRRAIGPDAKSGSLRNFPMQANGAEMLRLACCLVTEAGITLCAPNHDALLIEAPLRDLDDAVATTQRLMAEASADALDGFGLTTSVRAVRAPERWTDPRGTTVWSAVETALARIEPPAHQRDRTCSPADARTILLSVYKRGS